MWTAALPGLGAPLLSALGTAWCAWRRRRGPPAQRLAGRSRCGPRPRSGREGAAVARGVCSGGGMGASTRVMATGAHVWGGRGGDTGA